MNISLSLDKCMDMYSKLVDIWISKYIKENTKTIKYHNGTVVCFKSDLFPFNPNSNLSINEIRVVSKNSGDEKNWCDTLRSKVYSSNDLEIDDFEYEKMKIRVFRAKMHSLFRIGSEEARNALKLKEVYEALDRNGEMDPKNPM